MTVCSSRQAVESVLPSAIALLLLAGVNSVNMNGCRELDVSCCRVLRFRMAVLGRPEPAAISGNTSQLPHFLVCIVFQQSQGKAFIYTGLLKMAHFKSRRAKAVPLRALSTLLSYFPHRDETATLI